MSIEFFPSARRRVTLQDYRQLKSAAPENTERKKLICEMPLIVEDEKIGMPEFVFDAWEFMLKHPEAARMNFPAIEFKGITIEAFATPKARQKQLLVTDCDLNGFHIVSTGDDEDEMEYFLCFYIYAKDSIELHAFAKDIFHGDSFLTFEKAQQDLPLGDTSSNVKEFGANKRSQTSVQ